MTTRVEDFTELVRLFRDFETANNAADEASSVAREYNRLFGVDVSGAAGDIVKDARADRLTRYHRCRMAGLAFNEKWGVE